MMQAGFAIADITPRARRSDLCGFAARKQPSTRTATAIMARVVVFGSNRTRAAIAVCDLLGFRQADSLRMERAIARAARLPLQNVLLTCTHNHSGPMSMPLGRLSPFRPAYLKRVESQLVKAAHAALDDLQPVTGTRFGRQGIRELGEYRCCRQEPGRARWPGVVSALRLERGRGQPITFCHAGIHPYLLGWESRVLHPDFPGPLCDAIRGHSLFLPGCGADVSPVPAMRKTVTAATRYGRHLAHATEGALARGKSVTLSAIRSRVISPRIHFGFSPPLPKPDRNDVAMQSLLKVWDQIERNHKLWERDRAAGRLPKSASFRMHLLRLGELTIVGIPAEVFGQTGIALSKSLGRGPSLIVSHAGGNWGYLPRPFSYKHRTYESSEAHHWYWTAGGIAPGTEAAIRQAVVMAARKLTR